MFHEIILEQKAQYLSFTINKIKILKKFGSFHLGEGKSLPHLNNFGEPFQNYPMLQYGILDLQVLEFKGLEVFRPYLYITEHSSRVRYFYF